MKITNTSRPQDQSDETVDVLFLNQLGMWPADQGFRVHGCNMLKALHKQGVRVRMATIRPTEDAPAWLQQLLVPWPYPRRLDLDAFQHGWQGPLMRLRRRIASHQGVSMQEFAGSVALVRKLKPKVVVALGQHGPLMLKGIQAAFPKVKTIWYAADEPVMFNVSCLKREHHSLWRNRFRNIIVSTLIELLFTRGLDGAIGVSPDDATLLKRIGRVKQSTIIRNGVDLKTFNVEPSGTLPRSLVFWGRMDFEPNIDAMKWFVNHVWQELRLRAPDATLHIVGKYPTLEVRQLANFPGVEVVGEVPDIRPYARAASIVILPMRCGAGIKNKLLEAAALGLPMVVSKKAIRGLKIDNSDAPFAVAKRKAAWIEYIWGLWNDPQSRLALMQGSRQWVEKHHNWKDAAIKLVGFMNGMLDPNDWIELDTSPRPRLKLASDEQPPSHDADNDVRRAA